MKLVLLRHGESEWNKKNLFTGWTDIDLTEDGIKEAKLAGKQMNERGLEFDVCYTSYLKRAIHTLNYALDEMDLAWLPVIKSWKLNERHYGALQGLNKSETAKKYGEEQVQIWRRSFDVKPPELELSDERNPANFRQYKEISSKELPLGESLKTTIERVIPYYETVISKDFKMGKKVLIVAHGNSLRALIKHIENISDEDIANVNIPTGVPLVYTFDDNGNFIGKEYIGNQELINEKMSAVENQGSIEGVVNIKELQL